MGVKGDEAKGVISRLQDALSQAGVRAKLIYSGGVDLDILPEGASKGKGLEFLLRQVRIPSTMSLVKNTFGPSQGLSLVYISVDDFSG